MFSLSVQSYKNVCWLLRRVYTSKYIYIRVLNHINMYIPCTKLYMQVCVADVQCTDGYIPFMKCTDIVELWTYTDISFWLRLQLFYLPCRLACRLQLAASWCHTYSSSITISYTESYWNLQQSYPTIQLCCRTRKFELECSISAPVRSSIHRNGTYPTLKTFLRFLTIGDLRA